MQSYKNDEKYTKVMMAVNEYKTKDHHYDQTTKKDMLRQKIKEIFR